MGLTNIVVYLTGEGAEETDEFALFYISFVYIIKFYHFVCYRT